MEEVGAALNAIGAYLRDDGNWFWRVLPAKAGVPRRNVGFSRQHLIGRAEFILGKLSIPD